jgi:hypothetical protein
MTATKKRKIEAAMSISVPRWRFTEAMVQDAPEWKGVYVLWSHGSPLAVGHARGGDDTLRSRLLAHYAHAAAAPDMGGITHYSWEICPDPAKREAQIVQSLGLERRPPPESWRETPTAASKAEWTARESS